MPKTNRLPSYCHHKGSGKGVVTLAGRDVYLPGLYKSRESKAAYDRLISEYLAGGRQPIGVDGACIAEVCLAFLQFAKEYYRTPDGKSTSQLTTFQNLLKMLREAYGPTLV
ncbi:MAG: hypothetical protein ACP5O1_12595 [Phycisphaerae bacterium]